MKEFENTSKASILGIVGNLFLMIIKFVVALGTNSNVMMAETINSFSDIISSIMSLIGSRLSMVPSDENHNFGHEKAEFIFSMLISIFMITLAIKVIFDSIVSLCGDGNVVFSQALIIVCVVGIMVKLGLYLYTKKLNNNCASILLKALMKDHLYDMLFTFITLIASIFSYYQISYLDGILGIVLSLYIVVCGIKLFLESYKVLMNISLDKEYKERIVKYLKDNVNVLSVDDFQTFATGYKYAAIIVVGMNGDDSTFKTHRVVDKLEKNIKKKFRRIERVVIHVNPVKVAKKS